MKSCKNCGSTIGFANRKGEHKNFVKGYCQKCYRRYKVNGSPNALLKASPDGRTKMSEYHIWSAMRQRCNNKNDKSYDRYGGRGIKVCDRWDQKTVGFDNFLKDMGRKPEGYSLDRIDNDREYSPENCRWASANTQNTNRGNNVKTPGVTYSKKDDAWLSRLYYKKKLVICRQFKKYDDAVKARKEAELRIKEEYGVTLL